MGVPRVRAGFGRYVLLLGIGFLFSLAPQAAYALPASTPVPLLTNVTPSTAPSLTLSATLSPNPIVLGDTVTATLSVTNESSNAAQNVRVTLPTPQGAVATTPPVPATASSTSAAVRANAVATAVAPTDAAWSVPTLAGGQSTTFSTTFVIAQMPPGNALVLHPQLIADNFTRPISETAGATVSDPATATQTAFVPGTPVTLQSPDGTVRVRVPGAAATVPLTLKHTPYAAKRTRGDFLPPLSTGFHKGLGVFSLDALDGQGAAVHQFAQPLSLSIQYTPEQLDALGIGEADLCLFWYDPQQNAWLPIASDVDSTTHTVRAMVDHFSDFQLSDGASPSEAYLPTLNGGQVSTFTGASSYSLPIDVPAGAGGSKPGLALSYSSATTDGASGYRLKQQAGWVGKGWSLDTGSIQLNKITPTSTTSVLTYTLAFNGQSFTLTKGKPRKTNASPTKLDEWEWYPTTEGFIKAQTIVATSAQPPSTTPRGGSRFGNPYTRYVWQVWSKDGTRYDFNEDMWWGWKVTSVDASYNVSYDAYMEQYKWMLSGITDVHGNSISYSYNRVSQTNPETYNHVIGTTDHDIWPTTVTWGGGHYQVQFGSRARNSTVPEDDYAHEQVDNQYGKSPFETRILNTIEVYSNTQPSGQAAAWQLVRRYTLGHDDPITQGVRYNLYPDAPVASGSTWVKSTSYPKLALTGFQVVGSDGTTALPTTTFTYGTTCCATSFPTGDFNRLIGINNGQGGTTSFTYETIGDASGIGHDGHFNNYHRVLSQSHNPGIGQSLTTRYSYANPELNSLGTALQGYGQTYPNSAALYNNKYYDTLHDNSGWLATKNQKAFRGHAQVVEVAPDGTRTTHKFYQGEAANYPGGDPNCHYPTNANGDPIGGGNITTNACFRQLRNAEFLVGREYETVVEGAEGDLNVDLEMVYHLVSRTVHTGTIVFLGNADPNGGSYPLTGLWRSFVYEPQTEARVYDPTDSAKMISRTTKTYYDVDSALTGVGNPNSNSDGTANTTAVSDADGNVISYGAFYGNVVRTESYDATATAGAIGTRVSYSQPLYTTRITYDTASPLTNALPITGYMVDRVYQSAAFDGQDKFLGLSHTFYDGNATLKTLGTKGEPTQSRAYFDVLKQTSLTGVILHSADSTFTYDSYGNRLSTTTYSATSGAPTQYTGAGTAQWNGSVWAFGISTADGTGTNGSRSPIVASVSYDTVFNAFPVSTTAPTVNSIALTGTIGYDYRMGLPTSTTDANNVATSAEYDVFGRQTKLSKPGDSSSNPTVAMFYDAAQGQYFRYHVEQRAGTDIRVGYQFYDGMGRVIQTKALTGGTSSAPTQSIIADTVYGLLDGAGLPRVQKVSQPRYVAETASSFATRTTIPNSGMIWTTSKGDVLSAQTVAPDNTVTQSAARLDVSNSANLRAIAILTDANNHKIEKRSDSLGRLREVVEFTGNGTATYTPYATTSSSYDTLGRLIGTTDAKGNASSFSYDSFGRKLTGNDPDLGLWSYVYDVQGNLISQTDAKSQTISFTYDALNRLVSKASGSTTLGSFRYDDYSLSALNGTIPPPPSKGRMTESGNVNATSRVEYDTRGRTVRTSLLVNGGGTSRTHVYGANYDSGDRALSTTLYSDAAGTTVGETLSYTYDTAWRATSLHTSLSDVGNGQNYASVPTGNTYTALGGLQQLTLGNGVQNYWTYSSPMARVTEAKVVRGSTTLMDRTYDSYDNIGNITAFTDHVLYSGTTPSALNQTQSFVYDDLNRLSSVATTGSVTPNAPALNESYVYDVLGNLTNKGGVTQNFPTTASVRPHALTGVAGQSWLFEYDANGNTKKASGRQIEWDVQNMPTSVTGTDGVTESYTYDANGQRVSRTRPVTGGGSVTTLYFGLHEEEISSSQSTTRTLYSFGGCTVQRTAVTVGSMTTTTLAYLHGDHLGSVSLTTDASGAVTSQQNYDAWGKGRGTVGGTSPTTMNYTGQKRDDTGLLFYNARYYDPGIGRFLSADTIAIGKDSQSRNRYTYVGNNPINRIDPSGHCTYKTTVEKGVEKTIEDPSDKRCWDKYHEVTSKLGFNPDDLDTWNWDKLENLLKWLWLGKGLFFDNSIRKWNSSDLEVVMHAFNRIFNAFCRVAGDCSYQNDATRNLMAKALGLWLHPIFFFKRELSFSHDGDTTPTNRYIGGDPNGQGGVWLRLPDSHSGEDEYWVETAIHELGHLVNHYAGRGGKSYSDADDKAWFNATRIHNDKGDPTSEYDKDGAATGYANTDLAEDFSESFAYWVNSYNPAGGLPARGGGRGPMSPYRSIAVRQAIEGFR